MTILFVLVHCALHLVVNLLYAEGSGRRVCVCVGGGGWKAEAGGCGAKGLRGPDAKVRTRGGFPR